MLEFDSDIQFGEPVKRPLKYVDASDVLDVIVKAITEPGDKSDGERQAAPAHHPQQEHHQPTNNTNKRRLEHRRIGGGISITEGLETPEKDITPKAVILGSTKIIADPRENTIIVLGNDEVKQKIFTLLDQLDVRAPQVMLNTVIGEFTLNNDSNFGVDYLLHYPSGPLANLLTSGTSAAWSGAPLGHSGVAVTQFHRLAALSTRSLRPWARAMVLPRPSAPPIRWTSSSTPSNPPAASTSPTGP